ncbi:GIY-YIG nuclease family protein [Qipengyuania sp. 1NDH17]|uniref:GIY-YIG nuclease family protein n=1 Tax=Qipengyuania polymorpha TaxID=2867234 RepID=A0ABS7IUZ2_9SPHN|nr:GIY-YIG nuclease family protein [Qipengyuania polymorpha]MBX7456659.1 GIY-YIG nuclease family protein [Qipengyuania polymorpha]
MMEPTKIPVQTLDFPLSPRHQDMDADGNYKWPYSLLITRAWTLDEPEPVKLRTISSQKFNMDAASGIVELTENEAVQVLNLAWVEVEVLQPSVRTRRRIERETGFKFRNGPAPSHTMRAGVMHVRHAPAWTYLFEVQSFEQRRNGSYVDGPRDKLFKVGWAFDFEKRRRTFNRYALPNKGGFCYVTCEAFLWDTAREAYRMEQQFLARFSEYRSPENAEVLVVPAGDRKRVISVWHALTKKLAHNQ